MPTAYLHIGMPKTATSSVQAALSGARPHLAAHGLVYPGDEREHSALLAAFHPQGVDHFRFRGERVGPEKARAMADALLADIADHAGRADPPDLFLSSEFLNRMPQRGARQIRDHFNGLGYDMQILCYVRHPVDQAQSSLVQAVKRNEATIAEREARPVWHSARATLTTYGDVFGRDALIVRDFRDALAIGPAHDALTRIGFRGSLGSVAQPHVNESFSDKALRLTERRNRRAWGHKYYFVTNWILMRIGGPKYRLPDAVRDRIAAEAAEEMAWLRSEFGLTLSAG